MYWKYGIAVEQRGLTGPEAVNYESVVRMQLGWIEDSEVGNLLFRAIARNVLDAAPHDLANFQSPVKDGSPTRGVLVQPYTKNKCNAEEAGSVVSYSPYVYFGPCSQRLRHATTNRGLLPNELFFHELVHALRDAAGHGNRLAKLHGALTLYGNTEEFIAVVVTNIYMTDPTNRWATGNQVGVRRNHHRFLKLGTDLSTSLDFFKSSRNTFNLIQRFCTEDDWFAKKLAETKATFNPVAAYFHNQAEARSNSDSATALVRSVFSLV